MFSNLIIRSVVFLFCVYRLALTETHSLQYFYTVVSGDIVFPEFTAVGMINDLQFMYFDSNTRKIVPKTEWINADDWNTQTETVMGLCQEYKNNMKMIMHQFKHSMSGVHTLQVMYGCDLEDDGTTQGFYQIGYDGEDFISFDKNTLNYTAANPLAVITKNKWDADRGKSEHCKAYLENTCIERLKEYVSYGKKTLERKAPEVSLLQKDPSSPVTCHATGFYPTNIIMSWKKYNMDHDEDVEVGSTLPNADGTFQKSINLSVKPEEWKKDPDLYRCVIQHVGAGEEIVLLLNENNMKYQPAPLNLIAIVVGCLVALVVVAAVIGLIVWKKRSSGYGKTSNQDTDSDFSVQTL